MLQLFILSLFLCTVSGLTLSLSEYDKGQELTFSRTRRSPSRLIGGPSEEKPITETVSALVASLEQEIKDKLSETTGSKNITGKVEAISFTQQLVSGINYFVKIRVEVDGKMQIFHVRIYKGFSGDPKLSGVSSAKEDSDPILYIKQN